MCQALCFGDPKIVHTEGPGDSFLGQLDLKGR